MSDEVMIAELQISSISDSELEAAFKAVVAEHKDAVSSIQQSMVEADGAYRKYLSPEYEPDEAEAKKDRATLNKAEKNIAEKFASLKSAYEKPLERIELNIRSIRSVIKDASGVVDTAVKNYENAQKAKKRKEIDAYFETKDFDLVPLDRLFSEKWLNKGTKITDIRKELDTRIAEIYQGVKVLEMIPEYGMAAKAFYLETLDMAAAMLRVDNMKANAEKLAREKIEREDREHRAKVEANKTELRKEAWKNERDEQIKNMVAEALDLPEPELPPQPEKPQIYEMTLKFYGTEENLRRLREWMTHNEISYEKVG